jgi:arylsulfatase A-like enzyme
MGVVVDLSPPPVQTLRLRRGSDAAPLYLYFIMQFSRRHFFLGTLALPAFAQKKTVPERPNILILVADNVPQWTLAAYGNKEIRTPAIGRLAATGLRFLDHMTASPSPVPARASLLTGLAPGKTGPSLENALSAAGYTCNSGTDALGAVRIIDGATPGKPFFAVVNLTSPRPPYENLAQKYRDMYAQTGFDTFAPEPAAPNAKAGKEFLKDTVGSLRKYAGALTAMDDEVQSLIVRVQQKRIVDQTIVVFTSTCGALLGHHGLWDAGDASDPANMYDESVATPMIVSWPVRIPPGTNRPEIVSSYDLVPTLCDLTGVSAPGGLCGRSYSLLVTGKGLPKKERWRSAVFAHLENTWMARGERYKVVVRDGGKGELYDVQADREEKTNQFENPQYLTVKTQLSAELASFRQKNGV